MQFCIFTLKLKTMDFLQIIWEPASDGIRLFGNFKIHYYSMMWIAVSYTHLTLPTSNGV